MIAFVSSLLGLVASPPPLGFSFAPGGLLFPYYVGVAYSLESAGLLQPSTPLGGSSAGAIVAAAVATGVSESEVRRGLADLLADYGAGISLNVALRKQLDTIFDEQCHERAEAHGLRVCFTQVLPWPRRRVVDSWASKQDLIDTVCASSNWPLFFSRWPLVWCRGGLCVDGFFAVDRARFGCPPLPADRTVAITALPRVSLPAFDDADIIQPGRFPSAPLPMDESEWFQWAINGPSDELVDEMVGLGRTHARLWAAAQEAALSSSTLL